MSELIITPLDNGPLKLEGHVRVVDAAGKIIESAETIALCRCGQSANKPFCDTSHQKVGFTNQVRAT